MGFRIACLSSGSCLVVFHIRRDCPVAPESAQVMTYVIRERQRGTCMTNLLHAMSTVSESTTSEGAASENPVRQGTVGKSGDLYVPLLQVFVMAVDCVVLSAGTVRNGEQ